MKVIYCTSLGLRTEQDRSSDVGDTDADDIICNTQTLLP
jgi:hypothetical protein